MLSVQIQPFFQADCSILELYILVCMRRLEVKEQDSYNFNSVMKGAPQMLFIMLVQLWQYVLTYCVNHAFQSTKVYMIHSRHRITILGMYAHGWVSNFA